MRIIRILAPLTICICMLFLLMNQFFSYDKKYRYIYLLITLLFIVAFSMESEYVYGCKYLFFDCKYDSVLEYKKNNSESPDKALSCQESNRVCWRRSLMLSFMIFLILNIVNPSHTTNFIVFILAWFLLYFYFNFDAYHRFGDLCFK